MKKKLLLLLTLFIGLIGTSQTRDWKSEENKVLQLNNLTRTNNENIEIKKLHSQNECTGFLIWVSDSVKPHYHKEHNETLYFIEGEGFFYIGGIKHKVKEGSYVTIPKTVVHSFKTTSDDPVKAISLQAPEFFGKDRTFIKPSNSKGNPDY